MHYCYPIYTQYFYFGGQRSLWGHFWFWARKLSTVEFFCFKLGQCIFLLYMCIYFLIQIKGHLGGQEVKFDFQLPLKY